MANDWKYSTLTQRERFKLITSGNSDVYNTEKQRNKALRAQQQELGIDTKDLDLWDEAIDRVYLNATDKRKVNDNLPKIMSAAKSKHIVAYERAVKAAEETAKANREKATQAAIVGSINLEEFLANNGLSRDGSYANREYERIGTTLQNTLKAINKKFVESITRANEDYIKSR